MQQDRKVVSVFNLQHDILLDFRVGLPSAEMVQKIMIRIITAGVTRIGFNRGLCSSAGDASASTNGFLPFIP